MVRPSVVMLVVLSALFAGCVGENEEPPAPTPSGMTEATEDTGETAEAIVADDAVEVPVLVPVETAFTAEGSAPSGVWVCALAATPWPQGCNVAIIEQGDFVQDVAHTRPVAGIKFTMTFTPATPNINALQVMVHGGPDGHTPPLLFESGPSGTEFVLDNLHLNATDELFIMAWPKEDANVQGPVWVTPLVQPWKAEGVVVELDEVADRLAGTGVSS